jgi:hypothetical protein
MMCGVRRKHGLKLQQFNLEFNLVFIVTEKAFDEVFFYMCHVNASSVNCYKTMLPRLLMFLFIL